MKERAKLNQPLRSQVDIFIAVLALVKSSCNAKMVWAFFVF